MRNTWLGWNALHEPCLKVTLADGVRDLVLKYVSHRVKGDTLEVRTKDINYDLFVTLTYRVFPATTSSARARLLRTKRSRRWWWRARSQGMVCSAGGWLPTHLSAGRWAAENQVTQEMIHQGKKVLESRRMVTATR